MKSTLLLISFIGLLSSVCFSQEKLSPEAFQQKIKNTPKAQVIDVRTPSEFETAHLKNAQNINYYDFTFRSQLEKLDKNQPVFVYCKAGPRSQRALAIFKEMGFKQMYELQGGFLAWQGANLPFTK
jgi:rhodanese-related sulfurtransferase